MLIKRGRRADHAAISTTRSMAGDAAGTSFSGEWLFSRIARESKEKADAHNRAQQR